MSRLKVMLVLLVASMASVARADWNQTAVQQHDYMASGNDLVRCDPSQRNQTVVLPPGQTTQHGTCIGVTIWGYEPAGHTVTVYGIDVFPGGGVKGTLDANWESMFFYWDSNQSQWIMFLHTTS